VNSFTDKFILNQPKRPDGPETILVVEDDLAVREMTCDILSQNGYLVLVAESEKQALKAWGRFARRIDLLLTDVLIPYRTTGLELARRFKRTKPNLKIVFTSGFGPEICSGVPALTGGLFLPKPFSAPALLRAIVTCLNSEEESPNELN
jgi:CheY-like chemotaxis protein